MLLEMVIDQSFLPTYPQPFLLILRLARASIGVLY